jgi:hypothetical protein
MSMIRWFYHKAETVSFFFFLERISVSMRGSTVPHVCVTRTRTLPWGNICKTHCSKTRVNISSQRSTCNISNQHTQTQNPQHHQVTTKSRSYEHCNWHLACKTLTTLRSSQRSAFRKAQYDRVFGQRPAVIVSTVLPTAQLQMTVVWTATPYT